MAKNEMDTLRAAIAQAETEKNEAFDNRDLVAANKAESTIRSVSAQLKQLTRELGKEFWTDFLSQVETTMSEKFGEFESQYPELAADWRVNVRVSSEGSESNSDTMTTSVGNGTRVIKANGQEYKSAAHFYKDVTGSNVPQNRETIAKYAHANGFTLTAPDGSQLEWFENARA